MRTQPFLPPHPSLLTVLESLNTRCTGARYVLPRPNGDTLRYAAPGASSTADLLLSHKPQAETRGVGSLLEHLGMLLRALHTAPVAAIDAASDMPLTWLRLSAWMDSPPPGPPAVLHARLRQAFGTQRWQMLTSWMEGLRSRPRVLLHGNPSLGLLVPSESDEPDALITGEELGLGSWQQDVGWVLGELHELRSLSVRLPLPVADHATWDSLAKRFSEGYGLLPDPSVHRAAALRTLLHLHDFCVFVTWDDTEIVRYTTLISHLVDEHGKD